jgi:hypothetical protein
MKMGRPEIVAQRAIKLYAQTSFSIIKPIPEQSPG